MTQKINKTIAVAALARDCADALARNIPRIETLRTYFTASVVVVVENDSIDGTKDILHTWSENGNDIFILEGKKTVQNQDEKNKQYKPSGGFNRIEKLTTFRNQYMDFLQSLDRDIDFLIVIDIDIDDFEPDTVIRTINGAPNDWTGLFANGVKYFSLFSKRIPVRYYDDYAVVPYTNEEPLRIEMTFDELKINREKLEKSLLKKAFVKVASAFGGIGVYKYEYVKALRYKTGPNTQNAVFAALCEHISINVPLLQYGCNYAVRDLFIYHTQLKKSKDILLEFLPAWCWLFLYKLFKK